MSWVTAFSTTNDCPNISSNHDIDQIKFLREELKNTNTIINILLENIFSNNRDFDSYKKLEDKYENNVKKKFETPERYSFKNSDKTQDAGTVITQNRYEVLSDSDEINTNGCNNDNDKLSNNVRQTYHHSK